jgi:nucleotidyltransferase/DNA polymerase involved in DNA repair
VKHVQIRLFIAACPSAGSGASAADAGLTAALGIRDLRAAATLDQQIELARLGSGKWGRLWHLSRGLDERPVNPDRAQVGEQRNTFSENIGPCRH